MCCQDNQPRVGNDCRATDWHFKKTANISHILPQFSAMRQLTCHFTPVKIPAIDFAHGAKMKKPFFSRMGFFISALSTGQRSGLYMQIRPCYWGVTV
jgi:hypothetical protein